MKRITALALILGMACVSSSARAETQNHNMTVSANVLDAFGIAVDLKKDQAGFPDISPDTAMNFTDLVRVGNVLAAPFGIVAFINVTNTAGTSYTINSNCSTTLTRTGGTETIPASSFTISVNKSNAGDPGTVNFPGPGTAVANRLIFTQAAPGTMTQVEAHYYINNVRTDQRSGAYTTSLVLSATR